MDDFNNFFDHEEPQPARTPIYHTPESPRRSSKSNVALIISIVIAVVMTLVVIVNVIMLATLKDAIAKEYSDAILRDTYDQYSSAVQDALNDANIIEDVKDSATQSAIDAIKSTVGEVAFEKSASVARIYMYESKNDKVNDYVGMATAFLITDADEDHPERYLVTNAHCVRYAVRSQSSGIFGSSTYKWASYGKWCAFFDDDDLNYYELDVVAYGSYNDDNISAENSQPDLALLKVTGTQPSNEQHPALELAASDYTKPGTPIALIGNPEGIGTTNSISTGCVSQTGIKIKSWGFGTFILTDAALNNGNSGGPMVDRAGHVVGVAESKLVEESIDNMGFALSAATLRNFLSWASLGANNTTQSALNLNCKYFSAVD